MSTGRDDDALRWDGDDDPTLDAGGAAPTAPTPPTVLPVLPDGFTAVGKGSDELGRVDADGTVQDGTVAPLEEQPTLSNATLVTLGILGGVYALFTIGWIVGGLRLGGVASFLVGDEAFVPFLWLAIAAPALWFGTTLFTTRGSATWVRIVLLLAGAVLLVPWPFVMIGAFGR